MSKKTLPLSNIENELKGSSLFFTRSEPIKPVPIARQEAPVAEVSQEIFSAQDKQAEPRTDTTIPRYHDTTIPAADKLIEQVRRAVRQIGKEAATHRFTLQEKHAINDLIYQFRREDIRTSENELARIAINYLLEDFKSAGMKSIVARILKALNT